MLLQLLSLPASRYFSMKNLSWVEKGEKIFYLTMGSYDGAEICELVGLLDKVSKISDKVDGVNNSNGPLMDNLRKKIEALFKEENLSITIDTYIKQIF